MIVIARNNGPIYKGSEERRGLKEGKSYNVIQWSYQNPSGVWITETKDFINTKEPKFYVKVINEDGIAHDYGNNYYIKN